MLQYLYSPLVAMVAITFANSKMLAWPLLWWPWAFQKVTHVCMETFFASTRALWHLCHGTPLVIHVDKRTSMGAVPRTTTAVTDPPAMIVSMNHRTRLDWLTMWQILPQVLRAAAPDLLAGCGIWPFGVLSRLIIVLKMDVLRIPWMGWACSQCSFIYLVRDWEKDEKELRKRTRQLVEEGNKPMFLVFAEGSDLSEKNLSKSLAFAASKGVTPRFSTLFPRVKGMQAIVASLVETLRSTVPDKHAPDVPILDLTVDYGRHTPQGEADLVRGVTPERLDVWVQRRRLVDGRGAPGEPFSAICTGPASVESSAVDATDEGVEAWLKDSFLWREATLRQWQGMTGVDSVARCAEIHRGADGLLPQACTVAALDASDARVRAWREAEPRRAAKTVPMELREWAPQFAASLVVTAAQAGLLWFRPIAAVVAMGIYVAVNMAVISQGGWDAVRDVFCRPRPVKRD